MAIRKSSISGVPFGSTNNRPSSPQIGQTYYNGSLGYLEIYTEAGWIAATGANDFSLNLSGPYTSVIFTQSYSAGSYSIVSNNSDSTLDIYAFGSDGSLAGYTNTKSFISTQRFVKMVIIGGTAGDVLAFSYKTTFVTIDDSDELLAGPVASSVSPSSSPNIDDTFTLTGRNFASNCTVTFSSSNPSYTATSAKNIVRSSATSLIVTRPDNLVTDYSPYTITVQNPGVSNPTGSNSHILSNCLTAGTNPAWSTSANLNPYTVGWPYNVTLVATDTEGSDIDYTVIQGTLPNGISLNQETGLLSGTPTGQIPPLSIEGATNSVNIRATDAGGNYLDRAFTFTENYVPTWITDSGAISSYSISTPYSYQLNASGGTVATSLTYTIASGSLPSGFSLSSSGLISGTTSSTTLTNFTVRVTDSSGVYVDRSFSIKPGFDATGGDVVGTYNGYKYHKFNNNGTFNVISNYGTVELIVVGGGGAGNAGSSSGPGGGAGALYWNTAFAMPSGATSYSISIGSGGNFGSTGPLPDTTAASSYRGGSTTAFGITAIGGGAGGSASTQVDQGATGNLGTSSPGDGGSGGGTYNGNTITFNGLNYGRTALTGAPYYGNNSGAGNSSGGGGGGGAGGAGTNGLASVPGEGGAGIGFNWTGTTEYLAGGGGGGSGSLTAGSLGTGGGAGGSGVGGNGGGQTNPGTNAVANRGSGGGGSGSGIPGAGSAGTVWIRYPI